MKCNGVNQIKELLPNETNAAAEEGTAAAELLEHMLKQLTVTPQVGTHARNGVLFDSEMYFYITGVARVIMGLTSLDKGNIKSEQEVSIKTQSGIEIKGTYDVSHINGNTLHIVDLKYGFGIVEPKENWQLLAYAIGEVIRLGRTFEKITMTIMQPRPYHEEGSYRDWTITYSELMDYYKDLEYRMQIVASDAKQLASGSHCKYCPAAHSCPALNRSFYEGLDVVLEGFRDEKLNTMEIADQLTLVNKFLEVAKIKKDSMEQLAINRIKIGQIVPGYTTEQSFGDRQWKKEVSPQVIQMMSGIDITDRVMLSPNKAEKAGVPKELIKEMVTREFKGMKLVKKDSGAQADKIFNNKGEK
jgi:hypothetical protein